MPKKTKLEWGINIRRGRIWWIAYYKDGKQRFESTGSADEKAADALRERRYIEIKTGKYVEPESQRKALGSFLEGLQADYRINRKKSFDWVELVCRVHLQPFFGLVQFGSFRPARHIQQYRLHRLENGAANATVNHEVALLHRALVLAEEAGEIPVVPRFPRNSRSTTSARDFLRRRFSDSCCPTCRRIFSPQSGSRIGRAAERARSWPWSGPRWTC